MSSGTSVGELVVRLVFSLGVVLCLVWVLARFVQARGGKWGLPVRGASKSEKRRTKAPQVLEVTARRALSRNASVALVDVGERRLLLGVTDSSVRLLDRIDDGEAVPGELEGGSSRPDEVAAPDRSTSTTGGDREERREVNLPVGSDEIDELVESWAAPMPGRSTGVAGRLINKRAPRTAPASPPRMSLTEALRELTLRRN
jgi:flagellar biogenesis protein FliO